MIRLHTVVEGQTEEAFFNRVLRNHLAHGEVYGDAQLISSKRLATRDFKGGWNSYGVAKRHLLRWMAEDSGPEVWYTTMFDLYAIPCDFPKLSECRKIADAYQRVQALENAFLEDMRAAKPDYIRFVPHIQLHEFEALIFVDPQKLDWEFLEDDAAIAELVKIASQFPNPELINDRPQFAPSKRLISKIPEYGHRKASAGPVVADQIGLQKLRNACPHFHAWLNQLEALGA